MDRRAPPGKKRLRCLSCGFPLGRYTATCPNCGAAQPHKRIGSSLGLGAMIVLLLAAVLYGIFSGGTAGP